jgi:hypothetical protein
MPPADLRQVKMVMTRALQDVRIRTNPVCRLPE